MGKEGLFVTDLEYPEFAWKEIIINAIAHRDYNIKGTDIQIKMFDDRITVESLGIFPGIVRPDHIRTAHFSRNPKIAQFLHEYDYVQEFGEGVDRMFREMKSANLPDPEYKTVGGFLIHATIRNQIIGRSLYHHTYDGVTDGVTDTLTQQEAIIFQFICQQPTITYLELSQKINISRKSVAKHINALKAKHMIERVGSDRSGYWKICK